MRFKLSRFLAPECQLTKMCTAKMCPHFHRLAPRPLFYKNCSAVIREGFAKCCTKFSAIRHSGGRKGWREGGKADVREGGREGGSAPLTHWDQHGILLASHRPEPIIPLNLPIILF